MNSSPFREVGCGFAGATVPVFDPMSSMILSVAPLYSDAQAACIGPPLQITDATGSPASSSQIQHVPVNGHPAPFTFYTTNRSGSTVSVASGPGCSFAAPVVSPGAIVRLDCGVPSAPRPSC
jgi:hypothetical protein